MKKKINLLIPLAIAITSSSCHSNKNLIPRSVMLADPYTGDWEFTIEDMPSGDAEGILNIGKQGYQYRASVSGDIGDMDLDDVTIQGERLKGHFQYKGFRVNVKGNFEGDSFEGKVGVTLISYPFKAKKLYTLVAD
jgi:hypothetical protein